MAKTAERTHQMMENYMSLHQAGYSNPEIADMFNVSHVTVIRRLQEIADKYGVDREELLNRIQPIRNKNWYLYEEEKRVKLNFEKMMQNFDTASASVQGVIDTIDQIVDKELQKENER